MNADDVSYLRKAKDWTARVVVSLSDIDRTVRRMLDFLAGVRSAGTEELVAFQKVYA
jgi:FtsZ-interacting cell division protein YlmF